MVNTTQGWTRSCLGIPPKLSTKYTYFYKSNFSNSENYSTIKSSIAVTSFKSLNNRKKELLNPNSCTVGAGKTKQFYTQWQVRFAYFKELGT